MSCTTDTIKAGSPEKVFTLSQCPAGWGGVLPPNVIRPGQCTTTGYSFDTNPGANAIPVCRNGTTYASCPGADFTSYAQTINQRPGTQPIAAGLCVTVKDGTPLKAPACGTPTGCVFFSRSHSDPTPKDDPPVAPYGCTSTSPDGISCYEDKFVCDKRYGVCRNAAVALNSDAFAYIPKDSPVTTYKACGDGGCGTETYSCKQGAGPQGSFACVPDPQGTMTYAQCTTDASKAPQCASGAGDKWACDPVKGCVTSADGTYVALGACQASCQHRCNPSGGTCGLSDDQTLTGFTDQASCQAACKASTPVLFIVLIVVICVVVLGIVAIIVSVVRRRRRAAQ